jgi:hypothetical protein
MALDCRAPWVAGELAYWRWRAGLQEELPAGLVAEPYRLSIAGEWASAAELWSDIGCPCEAALALGDADDEVALRQAFDTLQRSVRDRRRRSSSADSASVVYAGCRAGRDRRPARIPPA